MEKAIFISLEGGEGVGKSTQIAFITEWFKKHNLPLTTTFEPGGTELGQEVRKILKHAEYDITPRAELLLFNACRAELMEEVIKPAISNNISILSDRFCDSTFVYQSYGRGLDFNKTYNITQFAVDDVFPYFTFWLDLPPKEAFARKNGADNDRFEQTGLDFHNKVYEAYKDLSKKFPNRIKRIDASKSVEEVSAQIEQYLNEYFFENNPV